MDVFETLGVTAWPPARDRHEPMSVGKALDTILTFMYSRLKIAASIEGIQTWNRVRHPSGEQSSLQLIHRITVKDEGDVSNTGSNRARRP